MIYKSIILDTVEEQKLLETLRLLRVSGAHVKINHVKSTLITPGIHKVNMEKWRVNPHLFFFLPF